MIPDTNVTFVPVDEEIQSICYSDKYAAVVVDSTSGVRTGLMYTTRMERRLQALILTTPTQASSLTGTGLSCIMRNRAGEYNLDGHERFNGQFDFSVSLVRAGKNRTNSLITAGSEVMKEIKLR